MGIVISVIIVAFLFPVAISTYNSNKPMQPNTGEISSTINTNSGFAWLNVSISNSSDYTLLIKTIYTDLNENSTLNNVSLFLNDVEAIRSEYFTNAILLITNKTITSLKNFTSTVTSIKFKINGSDFSSVFTVYVRTFSVNTQIDSIFVIVFIVVSVSILGYFVYSKSKEY